MLWHSSAKYLMKKGLISQIELATISHTSATFSLEVTLRSYFYLWAEVLDKDAFNAFKESGDLFNKTPNASVATFYKWAAVMEWICHFQARTNQNALRHVDLICSHTLYSRVVIGRKPGDYPLFLLLINEGYN